MSATHYGRWGRGQLLAFSALEGPTDTASDLIARTDHDGVRIVMPEVAHLRFPSVPSVGSFAGDWFDVETSGGRIRGVLLDRSHLLLHGPVEVVAHHAKLVVQRQGDLTLIGVAAGFMPSAIATDIERTIADRRAWLDGMLARLPAAVAARPIAAKVLGMMKTMVCSAEGQIPCRWTTPDRWPHRHAYLWDSAFHAVAWRHLDPALGLEQLAAMLHAQHADGFIPHRMGPEGGTDITQPPVLAWAAAEVLAMYPSPDWLAWAYPRLERFLNWFVATRQVQDGLLAWQTTSITTCRCDESGWDNSPRFDLSPSPLAIDLNAFLVREYRAMAGFAATLGRPAEATAWTARATALAAAIDRLLWDEERGIYGDRSPGAAATRPLRTPAGLLPLVHGLVSDQRASRMAALVDDPQVFGTPVPLPSVAVADQVGMASLNDMWRGPVWININHQVIRGLQAHGFVDVAERVRSGTVAAIERWFDRQGSIYEFYDPFDRVAPPDLPRKGRNDPSSPYHQVIHDFGWSATCWLDLVCMPKSPVDLTR